jgi:hypothetical protein
MEMDCRGINKGKDEEKVKSSRSKVLIAFMGRERGEITTVNNIFGLKRRNVME